MALSIQRNASDCINIAIEHLVNEVLLILQDVVGKNILKVEPLNAILDPHYFVRAVHECVMAWLTTLKKPEIQGDHNATIRQAIQTCRLRISYFVCVM